MLFCITYVCIYYCWWHFLLMWDKKYKYFNKFLINLFSSFLFLFFFKIIYLFPFSSAFPIDSANSVKEKAATTCLYQHHTFSAITDSMPSSLGPISHWYYNIHNEQKLDLGPSSFTKWQMGTKNYRCSLVSLIWLSATCRWLSLI